MSDNKVTSIDSTSVTEKLAKTLNISVEKAEAMIAARAKEKERNQRYLEQAKAARKAMKELGL
jgi:cell division ATPase FtsA